ncbi:hypothetical protein CF168_21290 (plasmid) [Shewanella bicestrii]|uniref:DUF4158 domain-containing protein n=1 Tax=Shewanella bicestrii TaxID=2018305 RepID=A0A220UTF2_9GAMM|nr:hypothetical protein CF168_21290 [Shewanella bicestrii]
MSRRHIFTERQRAALFDLPTDELSLLKFYTLGDDDLENIRQRRRPENRIGFALQLCALRYPGRALAPGEMIPREVLSFVGAQLGVPVESLAEANAMLSAVSEDARKASNTEDKRDLESLQGWLEENINSQLAGVK